MSLIAAGHARDPPAGDVPDAHDPAKSSPRSAVLAEPQLTNSSKCKPALPRAGLTIASVAKHKPAPARADRLRVLARVPWMG